jgi:hypothetical protein
MAYSFLNLSSSPNGGPIQITTTGATNLTGVTPLTLVTGQPIHSGIAGTSQFDEVFLYATNRHGTGVYLVLQWGSVTSGASIQTTVAPNDGFGLVAPGLPINSGSILYAYSNVNGPISVMGYVQRGP